MNAEILAYAATLPQLRLAASAYDAAWGASAAVGLKSKAFCAYDEDPITLGVEAARRAFVKLGQAPAFDALFVGSTTLPYEEKPSSASLLTALSGNRTVRVVEIRGSVQAGLQALLAALEFCAAYPGKVALAVAADSPAAPIDAPYEHALAAGACAFVVGSGTGVVALEQTTAISTETFGSRFRRRGDAILADLELRVQDDAGIGHDLVLAGFTKGGEALACGLPPRTGAALAKQLGIVAADSLWPILGDAGAASAALALADALDRAEPGDAIAALAVGGGATALRLRAGPGVGGGREAVPTVAVELAGGQSVDYMTYLRHRRMVSTRMGATG